MEDMWSEEQSVLFEDTGFATLTVGELVNRGLVLPSFQSIYNDTFPKCDVFSVGLFNTSVEGDRPVIAYFYQMTSQYPKYLADIPFGLLENENQTGLVTCNTTQAA